MNQTPITPAGFAKILRKALAIREESFDPVTHAYAVSNSEAARRANETWAPLVACLLTAGFCDMWDWADEAEKPEPKPVAPSAGTIDDSVSRASHYA